MHVHHLNCGSMREIPPGADSGHSPARAVNHCLLVEADDGLVLVETGFGTVDLCQPQDVLSQTFLDRAAPVLDPSETALSQVEKLGYDPADVRHIVLTHLDLDHTGGLPDFPHAQVHLHDAEYWAAMATDSPHPEHQTRYRPAHWAHQPRWVAYQSSKAKSWFGFDAIELEGLPPDILLIPLGGHTEGHCGVAVRGSDGWLLHAGDAYYYQGQIDPSHRWAIPGWNALEELTELDRPLRIANHARLRELLRDHGDEVAVFSAHDPWEFARHSPN